MHWISKEFKTIITAVLIGFHIRSQRETKECLTVFLSKLGKLTFKFEGESRSSLSSKKKEPPQPRKHHDMMVSGGAQYF